MAVGPGWYRTMTWKHVKDMNDEDRELEATPVVDEEKVIDLLMIMDCTGSMGTFIELSKRTLKDLANEVKTENEGFKVRSAFVGYRDFCDGNNIFAIRDFTLDAQAVETFIANEGPSGGGDEAEDVQGALDQGLKLNWRPNSVKLCYFCADAAGHGAKYGASGDDYRQGNPDGLVLEDLMKQYSTEGISFTVYQLQSNTNTMYEIMEAAYKTGENNGDFTKIDLTTEVSAARGAASGMEMSSSPIASSSRGGMFGAMMSRFSPSPSAEAMTKTMSPTSAKSTEADMIETGYRTKTSANAKEQMKKHRVRKGY